jgi:hypothetical protein
MDVQSNRRSRRRALRVGLPVHQPTAAFTVNEFCSAHRISRALLYILLKQGRGPAVMKAGRRTLISSEAAEAWRRRMEVGAQ